MWRMERDGIAIKVNVILRDVDPVEQIVQEETTLNVSDRGQTLTISNCDLRRVIYPQEFHLLIDAMNEFEFVGWWNNWDLNQPLSQVTGEINRPIAVVRRV